MKSQCSAGSLQYCRVQGLGLRVVIRFLHQWLWFSGLGPDKVAPQTLESKVNTWTQRPETWALKLKPWTLGPKPLMLALKRMPSRSSMMLFRWPGCFQFVHVLIFPEWILFYAWLSSIAKSVWSPYAGRNSTSSSSFQQQASWKRECADYRGLNNYLYYFGRFLGIIQWKYNPPLYPISIV